MRDIRYAKEITDTRYLEWKMGRRKRNVKREKENYRVLDRLIISYY